MRIPSGEIQRLVTTHTTYTPANATRRLRELAEEGELKVDLVKGHAHYTYVPQKLERKWVTEVRDGMAYGGYQLIETT